ncbi:MAG: hypothetical protein IKK38_12810 [Spirochaetaceae bacterium]|nr:hypothetical protein [Spirochaetaceae bacterium]
MSNRTAEASKAIREAWEREKELVLSGKGTRDWTPEQQKDILERGKAYDEDGKAFEGHHMKSAEKYPQYQGDPYNIQFLTRTEHKEAHGGDFHNPTNGYYDYKTKETTDFGNKEYKPCEAIKLTQPLKKPRIKPVGENANGTKPNTISMSQLSSKESSSSNKDELDEITETYYKNLNDTKSCNPPKKQEGLIKTIKSFLEKHPIITELVKTGVKIGAEIVVDKVTNNYTNKPKQSNDTLDRNNSQPNNDNSGKKTEPVSDSDSTKSCDFFRNGCIRKSHLRKSHLRHYSNGKISTIPEATVPEATVKSAMVKSKENKKE